MTALSLTFIVGCGSVGPAQRPVDDTPPRFVDARTGTRVEPLLIIPKYGTSTGVSTLGGHGPGRMTAHRFLASPFVYWEGNRFHPSQPDSRGVLVGAALFAGKGATLDGVVVISRGHKALWWWDLWERDRQRLTLQPIDEATAYRRRLLALLESDDIRGRDLTNDELNIFSLIADYDLKLRFSAGDRRMIREFLATESKGPA